MSHLQTHSFHKRNRGANHICNIGFVYTRAEAVQAKRKAFTYMASNSPGTIILWLRIQRNYVIDYLLYNVIHGEKQKQQKQQKQQC